MKLSKKFYDTLGEDLANELVDWFNQVDTTYRTDLREFNELNFQRFDAKMEQRLAQYDAKWEQRIAQLQTEIHRELITLRGDFRSEISALRSELIKWMFGFWVTSTATSIGVAIAVVKALA